MKREAQRVPREMKIDLNNVYFAGLNAFARGLMRLLADFEAYDFVCDARGESCAMRIFTFADGNKAIEVPQARHPKKKNVVLCTALRIFNGEPGEWIHDTLWTKQEIKKLIENCNRLLP